MKTLKDKDLFIIPFVIFGSTIGILLAYYQYLINEVCIGTDLVHILQWNGTTYVQEAVLPTFGYLAVTCIGDCDNDGKNEINVGSVGIDPGEEFMEWVLKYGW